MEDQAIMNQDQAMIMGRTAYMTQDNTGVNTLISELLDVDKILIDVELKLQGLELDDKGNKIKTSQPLCNKGGALNIVRLLGSHVNNVVQMSNFEEDQIRIMIEEFGDDVVEILTFNKKKYDLEPTMGLTTIRTIVCNMAWSCCMGAMENGMRNMIKKTSMETTINTQGQGIRTGKGGIGSLLGFGRK